MKKLRLFIMIFIMLFSSIFLCGSSVVYASSNVDITSSSVRDDLESMDMDKLSYLSDTENKFITMAQYYDNENLLRSYLYINYIGNVEATTLYVNVSTSVMDSDYNITENYQYYELSFVNNDETWCKYEILNLPNINETTRRYNIASINQYTIDEYETEYYPIVLEVNQTFIYNGITNSSIKVFHQEVETITITDKQVAFYCYGDSADYLFKKDTGDMETANVVGKDGDIYTDAWFIFFNTDKEIDNLLEVELTYTQYDYHIEWLYTSSGYISMQYPYTEANIETIKSNSLYKMYFDNGDSYVNYHDSTIKTIEPGTTKVSYVDKGWFGKYDTYYEELDNIMDLEEYKAQSEDTFVFTEYADKYKWGVNFANTEKYTTLQATGAGMTGVPQVAVTGSGMSDVAILRLKFEVNGEVKNCYAVDVPSDEFEGNIADEETNFEEWFEKIMMLIGVLVLVVILGYLSPIFSVIFKAFITCIKWALKGIALIITAPFKLIGALFKRK